MLFRTACDHCRQLIELSQVLQGKAIVCSHCAEQFVAYPVAVEGGEALEFEAEEPDMPIAVHRPAVETVGGRNSLALPAPPDEDWNESEDDDVELIPGQKFPYFRPRRSLLEPYLEPDRAGDDHSALYAVGFAAFSALLALVFLVLILIFVL